MKQVLWTTAILLITVFVHTAAAEDANRTATIVDKAGISSEVTDLDFSAKLQIFDHSYGRIALSTSTFDIAIPLENLISIKATASGHTVTYLWRGKEIMTTGKLFSGEFTGKSDFGNLELLTNNLKSIKYDRGPSIKKEDGKAGDLATLTLANGAKVTVNNLKRHESYYSSEGYLVGGSTYYYHLTNLVFIRGDSRATVSFGKIRRIAFNGERELSVMLKNGKKATGTIPTGDGGIVGFTGAFEKGEFFIAKKHVKTIEFGIANE